MNRKKITLFRSILWIFSSAVFINGAAYFGLKAYGHYKTKTNTDLKVPIKAIVQTGPQKEALHTSYLAELLGLSVDLPILTSKFDLKAGKENLLASPVISQADIKVHSPGILYVDYVTRQPIAYLLDYENTVLDQDRVPFPLVPFFTPKTLPEIYLGLDDDPLEWNKPIQGQKIDLAFDILRIAGGPIVKDLFNVKRIDVSNAFEKSFGRREIVLITEDRIYQNDTCVIHPRILRLPPKKYSSELSNYLKLREKLLEKEKADLVNCTECTKLAPLQYIDLRIPQLAFIDQDSHGL